MKYKMICVWLVLLCGVSLNLYAVDCNQQLSCARSGGHYDTNASGVYGWLGCIDMSQCDCTSSVKYDCVCDYDADCGYTHTCVNNYCKPLSTCRPCSASCGSWSANGEGYEKQNGQCGCNGQCDYRTPKYRCAAGYYGITTDGSSGCRRCPGAAPGSDSPKSAAGSTSATSCYVTKFGNSSGAGDFVQKCYYSN